MNCMHYTPGFFRSLFESCSSADFYKKIPSISLKRSVGFLFLLSITVAMISIVVISVFFDQREQRSVELLEAYDRYVPTFDLSIVSDQLQTIPQEFSRYFWFDSSRQLQFSETKREEAFFVMQVDTKVSRDQFDRERALPGIYFFQDAIVVHSAVQDSVLDYSSLQIDEEMKHSKETLRAELQNSLPEILSWAKSVMLRVGTLFVFVYMFVSSWFLALFSSLFGLLSLLIRQKPVRFSFLIKLSFYASVPALFIFFLTHLLGISVSFLPFLIYVIFYSYGMMAYQK